MNSVESFRYSSIESTTKKKEGCKPDFEQVCPTCGLTRTVGRICGGSTPQYYCRNCLSEFKVRLKRKPVVAEVQVYTASGLRANVRRFLWDEEHGRFIER